MSKAEKRAKERYWLEPNNIETQEKYAAYVEGYHQAEKDNELTWEDIREIYCITLNLREHLGASVFGETLYQEVLKRFKDFRESKEPRIERIYKEL